MMPLTTLIAYGVTKIYMNNSEKKKKIEFSFCISLTYSSLGDVRRRFQSAAEKELCDKSCEVTPSQHKKETSFFCSVLDFS